MATKAKKRGSNPAAAPEKPVRTAPGREDNLMSSGAVVGAGDPGKTKVDRFVESNGRALHERVTFADLKALEQFEG